MAGRIPPTHAYRRWLGFLLQFYETAYEIIWSGSRGRCFFGLFSQKKLGPLIGSRTWGGLIGISGVPQLIDGGGIMLPTFRMLNPDGAWFKEGHEVDPDIDVREDLGQMAKGIVLLNAPSRK
jgi:C-terminal processing protease CtpA/Prc